MKLKKGSLEAKKFMAKIRAKKGKPKKVSGVKKPSVKKTHTDIKSHNYKISISGNNNTDIANKIKSLYPKMNLTFSVNEHLYGLLALENTGNGYFLISFSKSGQILQIKGLKSGKPFKNKPKFI
jgi:hypothetical protein